MFIAHYYQLELFTWEEVGPLQGCIPHLISLLYTDMIETDIPIVLHAYFIAITVSQPLLTLEAEYMCPVLWADKWPFHMGKYYFPQGGTNSSLKNINHLSNPIFSL